MPELLISAHQEIASNGLSEEREFETIVSAFDDGSERRARLSNRCRRRYTISALEEYGTELFRLFGAGISAAEYDFLLPLWQYAAPVDAIVAASATTISVTTEFHRFNEVTKILLYESPENYEVLDISAVNANSIDIVGNVSTDKNISCMVVPIDICFLDAGMDITRDSLASMAASLNFTSKAGIPIAGTFATPWVPPVFNLDVDRTLDMTQEVRKQLSIFTPPVSNHAQFVTQTLANLGQDFEYTFFSLSELDDFLSLYNSVQGALAPIWAPTWQRDFLVTAPFSAGATTIVVQGDGSYTNYLHTKECWRHIGMVTPTSVIHRRVVNSVDNANGTESLELNASFGVAGGPNSLISFLIYSRLDSNSIAIEWLNAQGLGKVNISFFGIPHETPVTV